MAGQRHAVVHALSSAILAAGLAGACGPASAQTLRATLPQDAAPLPRLKAPSTRPMPPPLRPSSDEILPQARPSPPATDETGNGETSPGAAEPEVELLPSGVRRSIRDGEPAVPAEPEPVLDGVPQEAEEYRNPDGADSVGDDARDADDVAVFERPPAGHDPQAFGVELGPLDDRRPLALTRLDPWQPRGVRIGTYTLFPSVDLGAAWLSNIFRTRVPRSDVGLELRPTLRLVSDWRAHAIEMRATAGLTFLDQYPKEDDRAYTLEARGRLDVTRRTSVAAGVMRDVAQESRGTLDSRLRGTSRADVTTDEARLVVDHRFNRLGVQLRGLARARSYQDAGLVGDNVAGNRDRDNKTTEEAVRLAWTFRPTLVAFAEAAFDQRRFDAAAPDGIRRDSDGERYRAGLSFGNAGQILRGEASLGWGLQTPRDHRLAAIDGVLIDANVSWRINALTALIVRGGTDVTETTTLQSSGGFTRRMEAELRHAFLRPLIGYASLGIAATRYQGIAIQEQLVEAALGAEYYLAPEAVLYGRISHAELSTNASGGGWDAEEIRIGLRLRR